MNDLDFFNNSPDDREKLEQAFLEIQMPRPPYVLEKMVVNSKFTEEQRYAQCVLELSIAYDNLRMVRAKVELKKIDIDEIVNVGKKVELEKEILQIELEQTNRARLGALREFTFLYQLWKKFPIKFNREQLNLAQESEYKQRIEAQANQDKNATGRVSQGNQEALRQIGQTVWPELDNSREVEKRFLEEGKIRILLGVATEHKAEKGLPCIDGLVWISGAEKKVYNAYSRPVADNYNNIVEEAIKDKANYIITVEDDTFPQKDALVKLFELLKKNPKSAVGAWYPKKEESLQGVHIVLKDGIRQPLEADNKVHEVYTMSMGCSIYPTKMFTEIPYPWFKTTASLTQDSYFSQLAREAGWKLLVDTNIKCKHICRETGKVYQ